MDELLREFLTETTENLDVVDLELVKLEKDPNNKDVLDKIFRLVHTIKGTCGFLGLPRLERVAHAAETVLGKFRDGDLSVTRPAVTIILESLDCIKVLLAHLEAHEAEPEGDDKELIERLDLAAKGTLEEAPEGDVSNAGVDETEKALGRKLKPGEVSLAELEAAFNAAPATEPESAKPAAPVAPTAPPAAAAEAPKARAKEPAAETTKSENKEPSVAQQSIRVNVEVLEDLMTMVSELVLTRNQLLQMVRNQEESEFKVPLQRLSNVTSDLQEAVMKTRMQPIGNAWQKLPRIVRDLSVELGKKVELKMIGAETELDRQVLELIKDPLTHMVRNSVDHGLEATPADREAAGKPATGTITLNAYHEGGHIIIEIGDDGRGLNTDRIRQKAIQNGLVSEAEAAAMSDSQLHKFIFAAGFSTAASVTSVSGRGVGMDVVRTNIELIGGTIDLRSAPGKGTTFTIKIPLTLAIVSALIVETMQQRFAIPQISVVELVRASAKSDYRIETINKTPVLRLRDRLLPLVNLAELLHIAPAENRGAQRSEAFVVVAQVGNQVFGIIVDGVYDTEEIVVKPVATVLRDIEMYSGNTILGDGSVIMILDPNGIAKAVSERLSDRRVEEAAARAAADETDEAVSMLIFRAGSNEPKAVPLSVVTRLEDVEAERIEYANGMNVVQYRGKLMPLVTVSPSQTLGGEERQPILVFTEDQNTVGLAVDAIVDIVQERLNVELSSDYPGLLGTAVIRGKATEIIDVAHYVEQGFANWFRRDESGPSTNGRQLLLVDDSPFFLHLISPLLKSAGYNVTTASSADEALNMLRNGMKFDLVISDLEMPTVDGFTFARQVREDEKLREIPLIALSARNASKDVVKSNEAGFNQHVAKFDRERLLDVLNSTFAEREEAA